MDYLTAREQYKTCFHRWNNFQKQLCEELGVEGLADLEQALLERRGDRRLAAKVSQYTRLGLELDQASDRFDLAQSYQARRTAAATQQLNKDFAAIEC